MSGRNPACADNESRTDHKKGTARGNKHGMFQKLKEGGCVAEV